ncbi:exosortase family protein XrtG [Oenococcus oeni]|uniref:exosortase family protein XrtG n=1 Tax=Oenococcus oeni TaxID=1247 RepID=UPI0008F81030|nr:exosortase family protein XrtG [Oenococcus oeni]OIK56439.1 exosortase family protein XrtG [Oenococcus oeni]OIM62853.1 exosortase family protein XrtG [Oenococcus oeni]
MLITTIILIGTLIWVYILSVLKRAKLSAFYFITGSVGLFLILMALSRPYGIWLFSTIVTRGIGLFGSLSGMFTAFYRENLIEIQNTHDTILMFVDYECSGIIETTAFWSLIAFYPVYSRKERTIIGVAGALWIYAANILRLFVVATIVFFNGNKIFFLAHSVLGRLFFYILVIALYYNVFTRAHIIKNFTGKLIYKGDEK